MTPRASLFQYGANRPEKAGTKYTPPLSSTVRASASTSGDVSDQPQVVAQPLHERTGDGDGPLQRVDGRLVADLVADVVSRPLFDGTGCVPVFSSRKQPVP